MKQYLLKYLNKNYKDWDITIAMRYYPVVEIIKNKFPKNVRILEIGPGELGILPYLDSSYKITGVDIDFGNASQSKRMRMVKQTGNNLPFPDNSFDLVISQDTFEHVPPAHRDPLLSEALRVAKSQVIFGFPTGFFARLADSYLAWFYKLTHQEDFPYLSEHKAYSLPNASIVKNQFISHSHIQNKNIKITSKGNTNVCVWVGLLTLGFSEFKPFTFFYRLLSISICIFRYLNFPPCYRQILFVTIDHEKN